MMPSTIPVLWRPKEKNIGYLFYGTGLEVIFLQTFTLYPN